MHGEPTLRLASGSDVASETYSCPHCGGRLPRRAWREAWVEVPLSPRWIAAYRLVMKSRRPLVAEVRVLPRGRQSPRAGEWSGLAQDVPDRGLPGQLLRKIRLRDPISLLPAFLRNWRERYGSAADQTLRRFDLSARSQVVLARPGRRGRGDLFYAIWAAGYVELIEAGIRHPIKALSQNPPIQIDGFRSFGGKVSPETIRSILNDARHRGLLTNAPVGQAGGRLTAKAERVLRRRERTGTRR